MNPYSVITDFERAVARYCGAKEGVAVDSCTNAIFLSLRYFQPHRVSLPRRTYVGVAHAVRNAGVFIDWRDVEWHGCYKLMGTEVWDSARRLHRDMYLHMGGLVCLSFHYTKHLPIGRGGMILTNEPTTAHRLRKMRFDGRTDGVTVWDDLIDGEGWHMMIQPEDALRGLALMDDLKDWNEDLPAEYPDISQMEYFK